MYNSISKLPTFYIPHGGVPILFSEEELKSDFKELAELRIWEEDTEVIEGIGHSGKASIIRVIGEK